MCQWTYMTHVYTFIFSLRNALRPNTFRYVTSPIIPGGILPRMREKPFPNSSPKTISLTLLFSWFERLSGTDANDVNIRGRIVLSRKATVGTYLSLFLYSHRIIRREKYLPVSPKYTAHLRAKFSANMNISQSITFRIMISQLYCLFFAWLKCQFCIFSWYLSVILL